MREKSSAAKNRPKGPVSLKHGVIHQLRFFLEVLPVIETVVNKDN